MEENKRNGAANETPLAAANDTLANGTSLAEDTLDDVAGGQNLNIYETHEYGVTHLLNHLNVDCPRCGDLLMCDTVLSFDGHSRDKKDPYYEYVANVFCRGCKTRYLTNLRSFADPATGLIAHAYNLTPY